MAKFAVKVVETLSRVIIVDAETYEEAEEQVEKAYRECKMVLSADDMVGEAEFFDYTKEQQGM